MAEEERRVKWLCKGVRFTGRLLVNVYYDEEKDREYTFKKPLGSRPKSNGDVIGGYYEGTVKVTNPEDVVMAIACGQWTYTGVRCGAEECEKYYIESKTAKYQDKRHKDAKKDSAVNIYDETLERINKLYKKARRSERAYILACVIESVTNGT